MYFKSKNKKIAIITGIVVSAITLSNFSAFATSLPTESLTEQIIGISTEIGSSSEQRVDDSMNLPKDLVNEEIIEDALSKTIYLTAPGDYKLIGAQAASTHNNEDPNEIIVHTRDAICICGSGQYNIILDNVNIDIDDKYRKPISASKNANVNLILVGKNYLKNRSDSWEAALKVKSSLTIGASGEGASLDVYGLYRAIHGHNITIDGGNIHASSEQGVENGILGALNLSSHGVLIINGGDIKANSQKGNAIAGVELVINGGKIEATSKKNHAICAIKTLTIEGGDIKASSVKKDAIRSHGNMTIEGGDIKANSQNGKAIAGVELVINGTDIKATSSKGDAIVGWFTLTINGGNIEATSNKNHAISSISNIIINGGDIKTTSVENKAICSPNILTKGGTITSNFIKADNL